MRSHASSVGAIGFSSSTCRPASNASSATGSCRWCGTITSTALKPPAATASASDPNGRAPSPAFAAIACGPRRIGVDHRGDVDARARRSRSRGGATPRSRRTRRTRARATRSLMPPPPRRSARSSAAKRSRTADSSRPKSASVYSCAPCSPFGCAARCACIGASASRAQGLAEVLRRSGRPRRPDPPTSSR